AHRHRGDARDLLWQLQGVALGHQDQADAGLPGAVQLFVNAAHGLDPPLDGDLTSDRDILPQGPLPKRADDGDRKSTRLNSSHVKISYAVFCLKKKRERILSLIGSFDY